MIFTSNGLSSPEASATVVFTLATKLLGNEQLRFLFMKVSSKKFMREYVIFMTERRGNIDTVIVKIY